MTSGGRAGGKYAKESGLVTSSAHIWTSGGGRQRGGGRVGESADLDDVKVKIHRRLTALRVNVCLWYKTGESRNVIQHEIQPVAE